MNVFFLVSREVPVKWRARTMLLVASHLRCCLVLLPYDEDILCAPYGSGPSWCRNGFEKTAAPSTSKRNGPTPDVEFRFRVLLPPSSCLPCCVGCFWREPSVDF